MLKETALVSDLFPRGVVLRMEESDGQFVVRWNYQDHPYEIRGESMEVALHEALNAIHAQEVHGLV